MEIMRQTPWSRIKGQNSVYKEFLDVVGNESPTGSVLEKTIAVSATISRSVEKWHSRIFLRALSRARMREMHREPEVPGEEAPVVECIDGLARITSEELATIHSVKSGTLQNAWSPRPRVVVGLVKSARTHIIGLMNNAVKGPKRIMTKVQWLCWRRVIGMNENLLPTKATTDQGNLVRKVITSWNEDLLNADHLMHVNWVVHFKTWRRRSLFSGKAQTCRDQSNV